MLILYYNFRIKYEKKSEQETTTEPNTQEQHK